MAGGRWGLGVDWLTINWAVDSLFQYFSGAISRSRMPDTEF